MATASFPVAHKHVLVYEGGYSNHPADPGGPTLNGITQAVYDADRKARGLPRQALTPKMNGTPAWIAERDDIYRRGYWNPLRCDELAPGVDAAIYDYGVNSGIGRAAKVLQRLVGVKVDGKIGPVTIAAENKRDPKELVEAICAERLAFLRSLKTWSVFGKGWEKRVNDVRAYASAMAAGAAVLTSRADQAAVPAEASAKGAVPEPKGIKVVVGAGTLTTASAGGSHWWDWLAAHPAATLVILAAGAIAVGFVISKINGWHTAKQETPMPGFDAVPAKA